VKRAAAQVNRRSITEIGKKAKGKGRTHKNVREKRLAEEKKLKHRRRKKKKRGG